jgi:hypothetical protein
MKNKSSSIRDISVYNRLKPRPNKPLVSKIIIPDRRRFGLEVLEWFCRALGSKRTLETIEKIDESDLAPSSIINVITGIPQPIDEFNKDSNSN